MLHETALEQERALLVAVDMNKYNVEASLEELESLARTADIETVAHMIQARNQPDPATFIGSGKVEEVADFVQSNDINLVIFDHELTATQIRNLEKACDVAVIDRTMLILDIFSAHAHTSEGRIQVDLAQHRYLLPRLSGMGISLSRLGGGGGGGEGARRGKGETKLELDRRHIRRHIQNLENELDNVIQQRELLRSRREKEGIITVAIVGYTNVGKSTLLNALTDAGVLVEDKLFATLDPTSRGLTLPDGRVVMLVDTVGLVSRLPHHLVDAFKSTLEEAVHADLLLNVCDVSHPEALQQLQVTEDLLAELGVQDTPVLTVLNKADLLEAPFDTSNDNTVLISAKNGAGLEELLEKIASLLPETQQEMTLLIPYTQGGFVGEIREEGMVLEEEYTPEGIEVTAMVDRKIVHKAEKFTK